ncbi:hypothetical protein ROZALSC1DRAFT_11709 [Rozella allomycis CSF55]|uniref:CNH domain-containing protein n=1 Tax=Rozella allomycis (strain CSF55) TaxID=988480 RepID=A0A4V1J0D6_ROZAC|nr:hypothetical protein ROZALSC1DRAFT_11709 [Rozella allomycis CSF55]
MSNTKGCEFYSLSKLKDSVYLCIVMPSSVLIMKWAPHPFNRFMKLKEISVDVSSINMIQVIETNSKDDVKVFIGYENGLKMIDLQSATSEDISYSLDGKRIPNVVSPVTSNKLIRKDSNHQKYPLSFTWRQSLLFAAKLSHNLIVAGSHQVVDVWSAETGKIVHIFETKKNRIRSLKLLSCKGDRLFMLADEDRDGMKSVSVICIYVE